MRKWVRNHVADTKYLSQGARSWILGPRKPQPEAQAPSNPSFGSNVDANDPSLDLLAGQSETSIAATSAGYVLVGWNDATGFLGSDTTAVQSSLTGVGFSNDGGATFTDLVGLPNNNPNQQWSGDPSIVAIDAHHFAVASLYFASFFGVDCSLPAYLTAAVSIGTVNNAGTDVHFSDPVVVIKPGNLCKRHSRHPISLIDKEYLSYDPTSRTLAMSFTRFYLSRGYSGLGQIEVKRATMPADPAALSSADFVPPVIVWPEERYCNNGSERKQCGAVNAGSYPAVAPNGDVYVGWERNLFTNFDFGGDPWIHEHAAYIPAGSAVPTVGGTDSPVYITDGQVNGHAYGGVKSVSNAPIAGYTRYTVDDFPRIAYDATTNGVVFSWQDASLHPLGDIWLRSMSTGLASMGAIQKVNDGGDWALHLFPAVSVGSDGSIRTSWYDRGAYGGSSTLTDYVGEIRPSAGVNRPDFTISTGPTDWLGTSSQINPNFGDYTDNVTVGTTTYYTWSDGRPGVPQPFVDSSS